MRFRSQPVIAAGAVTMLFAAVAMTQSTPAEAEESPLEGLTLPVAASDVTDSDADLATVAREVVVVTQHDGEPQVAKLRAQSSADARRLASELDALPGVSAAPNTVFTLPEEPAGKTGKTGSAVAAPSGSARASGAVKAAAASIGSEPYGAQQWGLYWVEAEKAWPVTSGKGVTVAVVDSGVDRTHPDLAGRTLSQVDLVGDGLGGDQNGHGTHVAGIIAANLDGKGIAGLANQVSILPVRVLDADGVGDAATVTQGIYQAVDRGAKVINMSLGGTSDSAVLRSAVAHAVARGVTVVAAGGNDFANGNPTQYPAAYPNVIGVSSINEDGESSWFANTGSYIDLTAPGEDILSTVPGGWQYGTGTSMAAPFVSASAALVRAANPTLGVSSVTAVLQTTAIDDADGDGWDSTFGYGLVQADDSALRAAAAPGGIRAAKPVSVKVSKAGYGNVLAVDVNPDRGSASYAFRVQKRAANGTWTTLAPVYRTDGNAETKSITLGKGTFRVVVPASTGYAAATSAAVTLTDPTVKVRTATDKSRNKLVVDVDPNKGSGYWRFKVQQKSGSRWITLKKNYKTSGSTEKATVNLKKGTYRVVVAGKYGYAGTTSAAVTLVK